MSPAAEEPDNWTLPLEEARAGGAVATAAVEGLVVDVEGFEGPLDLLLTLARNQKLDLARISILALAEQYLAFVAAARRMRLELAADYLVMAAWLAYLKSRLLVPDDTEDDEPSGEMLAADLAFRLRRLEAMRDVSARLAGRARLGRDVFARGAPEAVVVEKRSEWQVTLYELLSAYAAHRQRSMVTRVSVGRRAVWSLLDARQVLERLIGAVPDWVPIDDLLAAYMATPEDRVTVRASSFSATLELAREGGLDLRQSGPFAPIFVRKRAARTDGDEAGPGVSGGGDD